MSETTSLFYQIFIDLLVIGLQYSLPLAVVSFSLGLVLAIIIALFRLYAIRPLKMLAALYVTIIRGTPLLIQLFLIFYALPYVGIILDPIPAAILGLSFHAAAYASEILRASLSSVPKALYEAGLSMGFKRSQSFRYILLPYAAYASVPPLFNVFIDILKATSLASVILVPEIMRKAREFAVSTNQFLIVYSVAAIIYLIFCLSLEKLQHYIETKLQIEKDR